MGLLRAAQQLSLPGHGAFDVVAGKQFGGEVAVALGAAGARVVELDRLAVTGGFGEADVARDGVLRSLSSKKSRRFSVTCWERLVRSSYMVRRTPSISRPGLKARRDALEGVHELADAFEGEVFGLHGDEEAVGGDKRVEGEKIEGRRAVEEDEVVFVALGLEGFAELIVAALELDELDVGADQVFAGGNDLEGFDFGGERGFGEGGLAEEDVVGGWAVFVAGEAEPPVELAWGSQSIRRVLRPSSARAAERLMAVVVFPTPPFWLTTANTLPMKRKSIGRRAFGAMEGRCAEPGINCGRLWREGVGGRDKCNGAKRM